MDVNPHVQVDDAIRCMSEQRNDGHRAGRPDNGTSQAAASSRSLSHHVDPTSPTTLDEETAPLAHLLASMGALPRMESGQSDQGSDLMALLVRLEERVDDTVTQIPADERDAQLGLPPCPVCPAIPERCTLGELGHWLSNLVRPRLSACGHATSCCVDERLDSLPAPPWLIWLLAPLPDRMCLHTDEPLRLDVHCCLEHQQLIVEMSCNDQGMLTSMIGPADISDDEQQSLEAGESSGSQQAKMRRLPVWRCLAHLADCCVMLDGMDVAPSRPGARLVVAAPITKSERTAGAGQIPMAG
ncbi:MAG: hypothetical protein D8M59_08505 [Planctomycetes bacterium]|nr:hypothetical protein [Planctomycetota bacterium]